MNDVQTVFALFFAIFLGTVANVQPRWKAFNWPMLGRKVLPPVQRARVRNRLLLALACFDVAPVLYFAFALCILKGDAATHTIPQIVLHGVVPAFAAFAFYRLWLSAVEYKPAKYYCAQQVDLPERLRSATQPVIEPTMCDLNLKPEVSCETTGINLLVAVAYLVVASVFLIVRWP